MTGVLYFLGALFLFSVASCTFTQTLSCNRNNGTVRITVGAISNVNGMGNVSNMVVIKVFGKLPRLRFALCAAIDMAADSTRIAPKPTPNIAASRHSRPPSQRAAAVNPPATAHATATNSPKKRYRDIHIERGSFHSCGSGCNGQAKPNNNEPLSKQPLV